MTKINGVVGDVGLVGLWGVVRAYKTILQKDFKAFDGIPREVCLLPLVRP